MRGGLSSVVPSRRPLEREKSTWDGLSGSTASSTFLGSRDTNSPRIDPTELRRRSARSGARASFSPFASIESPLSFLSPSLPPGREWGAVELEPASRLSPPLSLSLSLFSPCLLSLRFAIGSWFFCYFWRPGGRPGVALPWRAADVRTAVRLGRPLKRDFVIIR